MDNGYDSAPGFYGKVTTHGDFVTRRLPRAFIDGWDEWLQAGLHYARQRLGATWLNAYLTSPLWRFAINAGVLDRAAWSGVVMPSVDRVGRHFPLTIACPAFGQPRLLDWVREGNPWFENLEDFALSSLAEGFQLEKMEASLQATPGLTQMLAARLGPPRPPVGSATCMAFGSMQQLLQAQNNLVQDLASQALQGATVWWTEGSDRIKPCMLISRGMPTPQQCCAMMDGNWSGGGWVYQELG
ncbi:type VI secretion system-associated protein TagF [Massilia sp. W12]|uniref:type VI secretion system-associated protein TagF n=1 Tax=Massilia sp. W12 TaxID=3126507 RepID=UPI0030CF83B6